MANGGTLLLDEIGEMPLALQSKLLRAIEEQRVTPIGSDRPVEIDVRFIATTNKDLQAEVERGAFRRDLFYRLSVLPIRVPPLRERPGDIPLLAQHFLEASARRTKKPVRAIAPAAMQALRRYAWPGNVRELENVIERAVIVAKGETIADVERLPDRRRRTTPGRPVAAVPRRQGPGRRGLRARVHRRACSSCTAAS